MTTDTTDIFIPYKTQSRTVYAGYFGFEIYVNKRLKVDNNPNENTYKSVVQMDPEPVVSEELKRTMAMIRDRFNTIKILQRNFDTCVEAAKSNQEPAERARHNEPDGATPKEPDCRDLGYLIRDMAKTIQSLSMEMAKLSGTYSINSIY